MKLKINMIILPNGLLRNFGSIDCSILRMTKAKSMIFLSALISPTTY